jgi:hypothetical protein
MHIRAFDSVSSLESMRNDDLPPGFARSKKQYEGSFTIMAKVYNVNLTKSHKVSPFTVLVSSTKPPLESLH